MDFFKHQNRILVELNKNMGSFTLWQFIWIFSRNTWSLSARCICLPHCVIQVVPPAKILHTPLTQCQCGWQAKRTTHTSLVGKCFYWCQHRELKYFHRPIIGSKTIKFSIECYCTELIYLRAQITGLEFDDVFFIRGWFID